MIIPFSLNKYQLAGAVLGVLVVWSASVAIYRFYFHPLSHVPGPKFAAVTRLYLFYYNVIKDGLFYLELEGLHKKYGPVVRISPTEVHLNDPDNYDKIYYVGTKYSKDPVFYKNFGGRDNSWSMASNDIHRRTRSPMEPFFSRRSVLELEDICQEKAAKICRIVEDSVSRGKPVDLHAGFRGISVDVITEYAFNDCWDQLDRPDLGQWFSDMTSAAGPTLFILQQFPFILNIFLVIPRRLVAYLDDNMESVWKAMDRTRHIVKGVQAKIANGEKPKQRTIFHNLLDPELNSGHNALTSEDLVEEGFAMCAAASDTTGNAMCVATYHVLNNPAIYKTLSDELCAAFPDPNTRLDHAALEKLPYLAAVIKEGQRLSYGVMSRLPRVVPSPGATFNNIFIPRGCVVGMSSYTLHRDSIAFPNPTVFDPTRWLSTHASPQNLALRQKCLVPFSRGSRGCIGQNLAYCELYVTLGTFFRRFGEGRLKTRDVGELTYKDYFNVYHRREEEKLKVWGAEEM